MTNTETRGYIKKIHFNYENNKTNWVKPINIFDLYLNDGDELKRKNHGAHLPESIRCIPSGPSNCRKTFLMLNSLLHLNVLYFENIYIFSKSINQSKYQFLLRVFQKYLMKDILYLVKTIMW